MKVQVIYKDKMISMDAPQDVNTLKSKVRAQFKSEIPKDFSLTYASQEKFLDSATLQVLADLKVPILNVYVNENKASLDTLNLGEEKKISEEDSQILTNMYKIDLEKITDKFYKSDYYKSVLSEDDLTKKIHLFVKMKIEKDIHKISDEIKDILNRKKLIKVSEEYDLTPINKSSSVESRDSLIGERKKIAAWNVKHQFITNMKDNQILIVQGPNGSGKTTQIPQIAHEKLAKAKIDGKVCVIMQTEILAQVAAKRVAEEMGTNLGELVGYTLNFEDKLSPKTELIYTTYEKIFRVVTKDPRLLQYSMIIMDEICQRTLYSDAVSDYIKRVAQNRTDLKIIIMCDQNEADTISAYFNSPPVLSLPKTIFAVETFYVVDPDIPYLEAAARAVIQIHLTGEPGDILVFLPKESNVIEGEVLINKMLKKLAKDKKDLKPMEILTLHSMTSLNETEKLFSNTLESSPKLGQTRRCILTANISENSISIMNIAHVIDPGYMAEKVYDANMGIESIKISMVSREKARKRAACAGITQPGKCYRLYTQKSFSDELNETHEPELLKSNLASIIMNFIKLEINEVLELQADNITHAFEFLEDLGAFYKGKLTRLGHLMSEFPIEPQLSKALVSSMELFCSEAVMSIAAMLTAPNCFVENKDKARDIHTKFAHPDGDHFTLLNIYNEYKKNGSALKWCEDHYVDYRALQVADQIRDKLKSIIHSKNPNLKEVDHNIENYHSRITKSLICGYFRQVAILDKDSGSYITVKDGLPALIYPSNLLIEKPEICIYHSAIVTSKTWIKNVVSVKKEWLLEIASDYLNKCKVKII